MKDIVAQGKQNHLFPPRDPSAAETRHYHVVAGMIEEETMKPKHCKIRKP